MLPGFILSNVYFYIAGKIYLDLLSISDDNSWMIIQDEKSNIAECRACLKMCACDLSNRKCYRHPTEEIPIHLVNRFLYDYAYDELAQGKGEYVYEQSPPGEDIK